MPPLSLNKRADKRLLAPNKLTTRSKPNALGRAQVVPPYRVDLTLPPSTLDQINIPPRAGRDH
jgi:hypothetical protein